jgi:flagellar basal-body rod protein FlgC
MSLFSAFRIAGSGATAQGQRLNTVASNLANADSAAGPDGQVYKARHVIFEAVKVDGAGPANGAGVQGVKVSQVTVDNAPPRRLHDPKHPLADADGYVSLPNVNVAEEMVNMISAARSYENNIEVMNTARSLLTKTLQLGN